MPRRQYHTLVRFATRSLWQVSLLPMFLGTAIQADEASSAATVHSLLSPPTSTTGTAVEVMASSVTAEDDIPATLGLPLRRLFGSPPSMAAAAPSAPAALVQVTAEDPEEDAAAPSIQKSNRAKSPGKALFLSALLPGAGEYYAGDRKRAAVFLGLEALGWALWSKWDSKGNDVVDEFRATAREEWDPQSYISWRISSRSRFSSLTHALPCSLYVVNDGIDGLVNCPESESQQYYELIGKYNQFVSGWSDLTDANGNPVQPTAVDSVELFHSDLRFTYEGRRDDSNKFLERASTVTGLILVNHALSAIDASRVARQAADGKDAAAIESRTRFAFTTRNGTLGGAPILMAYKPFY